MRRECRVPRCGVCRRSGHDETQCACTYASVAGPAPKDEMAFDGRGRRKLRVRAASSKDTELTGPNDERDSGAQDASPDDSAKTGTNVSDAEPAFEAQHGESDDIYMSPTSRVSAKRARED